MLSHIVSDLHEAYVSEVFKPQLGNTDVTKTSKPTSDLDGDGDVDSFEKKVRQFIYDVRHLMRTNNIPVEKAFNIRSSKTNYGADVVKAAKEKLNIKSSVSPSVSEESQRMVTVTINYKNGTVDRRNVPYSEVRMLRAKPTIRSVEISSNKVSYPGSGEKYEKKYGKGGKNTVGDVDKDGTVEPDSHEYAGAKDNAIKKSMSKKSKLKGYGVSEGFSNWREDLIEVSTDFNSKNKNQVKEKKVNNYEGSPSKRVVVINPEFHEQVETSDVTILESFEIGEEYVNNVINIATEFFYNYGLNENGVNMVIEELGEEKFAEFVFDMAEEYILTEERAARKRKGGKSYEEIKAEIDAREASKKQKAGKKITADKAKKATETAKKEQAPSSEKSRPAGQERIRQAVGDTVKKITSPEARKTAAKTAGSLAKGALDTAARGALSAWKGHQKAMEVKKKGGTTAQAVGRGLGAAAGSFFKKGTGHFKECVESLVSEGYDFSDYTFEELYELCAIDEVIHTIHPEDEEKTNKKIKARLKLVAKKTKVNRPDYLPPIENGKKGIQEKAESEQQQKLFGLALSVKRGQTPRSEASAEVLKIVDTMSEKKIRDFAKTKHSGIPHKVDEAIATVRKGKKPTNTEVTQKLIKRIQGRNKLNSMAIGEDMQPTTNQQIAAQKKLASAEQQVIAADRKVLQMKQKKQESQKTGSPDLQKQSYELEGEVIDERRREEKGTQRKPRDPAFEFVAKSMGSSRLGVQPRGKKKEPGKKPPVAGQYGSGRRSPEQIVKTRRALNQKSIDSQSSRFD